MNKFFLLLILSGCLQYLPAQEVTSWQFLSDVSFPTSRIEQRRGHYGVPVFSDEIQSKEGQEIIIKGYMLPITIDNQRYILSQFPFSDCFFCGGAGKETVVELKLKLKEIKDFPIDDPIKIKGKLELIPSPHELCYRLTDAVWVK